MKITVLLPSLFTLISAHGFVQQIWLGDNLVDTWNPYKDPSKKGLNQITRKFRDNGPVTDGTFETDAITCNVAEGGNNVAVSATAEVAAGSTVKFMWTDWQSDHPGPSKRTLLPETLSPSQTSWNRRTDDH